ncbi:preprotein translocase subunit YajC [Sphingomonas vulcanisoli]|nr:preprotein translocase subunit YajC [Sphingomonas vulcanisoli]
MFASPAYAQSTGAASAQGGGIAALFVQALPLILIFGIFYILMIRPQQKRMKEQKLAIEATKKGDEVITGGGHIGKVISVNGDEVEVEFAPGHRHRVVKSMLAEVRPKGAKPAND